MIFGSDGQPHFERRARNLMETEPFRHRGFNVPGLLLAEDPVETPESKIEISRLAPYSSPLAWRRGLYEVGRDLSWNEYDAWKKEVERHMNGKNKWDYLALMFKLANDLPDSVKRAGRAVYKHAQEPRHEEVSIVHRDALMILPIEELPEELKPSMDRSDGKRILGKYFKGIDGFTSSGEIKKAPDTEVIDMLIPEGYGYYIAPPEDLSLTVSHEWTGIPRDTVEDWYEAVERWKRRGVTQEMAEAEISSLYIRDIPGIYPVISTSFVEDCYDPLPNFATGAFNIDLARRSEFKPSDYGVFMATKR
jgi:hypothetical protein